MWRGRETSILVEEEAQIDENGTVSVPNAGTLIAHAKQLTDYIRPGEKLYTGYTREYIKAAILATDNFENRILRGRLCCKSGFDLPVLQMKNECLAWKVLD